MAALSVESQGQDVGDRLAYGVMGEVRVEEDLMSLVSLASGVSGVAGV